MGVILEGGDSRSWISLLPRGAKYDNGVRLQSNWGGFPQITGKRLQWRYQGPKLVVLIVRIAITDMSDTTGNKENSTSLFGA
jgi:hypothetical protein